VGVYLLEMATKGQLRSTIKVFRSSYSSCSVCC